MNGLERARRLGARLERAGKVLRQSGVLGTLSPSGLWRFATGGGRSRMGVGELVRFFACMTPDKAALVDGDVRLDYQGLAKRTSALAAGLASIGLGRGKQLGILLPNCHEYVELQLATTQVGATAVQIGYRLKAAEVRYILADSGAGALVFGAEYADTVREALDGLPIPRERCFAVSRGAAVSWAQPFERLLVHGERADAPQDGGFGGVMVYTSGTTGRPKGAMRDLRRTGVEPVLDFVSQLPLRTDERHLVCCPLYHSAAPAFVGLTYMVGGTVVLADHFDPERVLALIQRERVTSSMMVPTMYSRLVHTPDEVLRRYDTSSLRWLISGAAPLPTALAEKVERCFGPILWNFYGATETGLVTLARPGEHTARPGTIGRLLSGNQIRLCDDAGAEVPRGEMGELWVKNAMLVDGYHGNEAATRDARKGGYFSVGDLARVDDDGYVYLTGRKHDMIISGGVNIYPLEIEQHLHRHPAVHECAIVGVPDEEWGETIWAFVVRRQGARLDSDEVAAFCRTALADFKRPRRIEFVDALPRNATGKVLRRELREWADRARSAPSA